MKRVRTLLKSIEGAPLEYGKYYEVPKKPRENAQDYEERTWRERCHINTKGNVIIPGVWFKKAIASTAKYDGRQIPGKGKATYTKHFVAGIQIVNNIDTGIGKEDIEGSWVMVPSDGKPGGGKRVKKCFPTIYSWEGWIEWWIVDDTITEAVFEEILRVCGILNGLGVNRAQKGGTFGTFTVEKVEWLG